MARFYTDNDVPVALADRLRAEGHDATATRDMHLQRADDDAQLSLAAQRGWILVTHNRKDFRLLHDAWRRWGRDWGVTPRHPGILIVPQRSAEELIALVRDFLTLALPLENELYEWSPAAGWSRRP